MYHWVLRYPWHSTGGHKYFAVFNQSNTRRSRLPNMLFTGNKHVPTVTRTMHVHEDEEPMYMYNSNAFRTGYEHQRAK
jgi:hypothetical protein